MPQTIWVQGRKFDVVDGPGIREFLDAYTYCYPDRPRHTIKLKTKELGTVEIVLHAIGHHFGDAMQQNYYGTAVGSSLHGLDLQGYFHAYSRTGYIEFLREGEKPTAFGY